MISVPVARFGSEVKAQFLISPPVRRLGLSLPQQAYATVSVK